MLNYLPLHTSFPQGHELLNITLTIYRFSPIALSCPPTILILLSHYTLFRSSEDARYAAFKTPCPNNAPFSLSRLIPLQLDHTAKTLPVQHTTPRTRLQKTQNLHSAASLETSTSLILLPASLTIGN